MFLQAAEPHDVGSALVDRVYAKHGTYGEHMRRLAQPDADPIATSIEDSDDVDGPVSSEWNDLYDAYKGYCEREGLTPLQRSSVLRSRHCFTSPHDGLVERLPRLLADEFGGVAVAHFFEEPFQVPSKARLQGFHERLRHVGVDRMESDHRVGERLIQEGVGDADREPRKGFLVLVHRNLNVLFRSEWMLQAGLRGLGAGQQPTYGRLRRLARRARVEAQQAGILVRLIGQRVIRPALRQFRHDLPMAFAAVMFAIGFPLGLAVLAEAML